MVLTWVGELLERFDDALEVWSDEAVGGRPEDGLHAGRAAGDGVVDHPACDLT